MSSQIDRLAEEGRKFLEGNRYVGRGVMVGMTMMGEMYMVCWTQGRSAPSRNRVYVFEDDLVRTDIADRSMLEKGTDTHNIIYDTMMSDGLDYFVSNGRQTGGMVVTCGKTVAGLEGALKDWSFEDDLINTPRISATVSPDNLNQDGEYPAAMFAILRREPWGSGCQRQYFDYPSIPNGHAFFLTTYLGDGNPPPHWEGEPKLLSIPHNDPEEIAEFLWDLLDHENRVSLALWPVGPDASPDPIIINKYEKVED